MKARNEPLMALKGRIREEGKSIRKLAPIVNVAPATLCLKINNKYDFSCTEISRICAALNIKASDIPKYFFPSMLRDEIKTG